MDMFSALADPTRRSIVEMLASRGQMRASDIYSKYSSSAPAVSQHLKVLRDTRVVLVEKRTRQRLYRINPQKIGELEVWVRKLRKQWESRLDRLETLLQKKQ